MKSPIQELIDFIDKYKTITGEAGQLIRDKAESIKLKERNDFNEAHRIGVFDGTEKSKGEKTVRTQQHIYDFMFQDNK